MSLEARLTEEEKEDILNVIERERRKVLITRLYEEGMNDNNPIVKEVVASSLKGLANFNLEKFLELYEKGMSDQNLSVRAKTAYSLGSLPRFNPKKFIQLYNEGKQNQDPKTREQIAGSLGGLIHINPKKFVNLYKHGMGYNDIYIRRGTVKSLRALVSIDLEEYEELYEEGLEDRDRYVRKTTASSLGALAIIDPERFVRLYERNIKSNDIFTRWGTFASLAALENVEPKKLVELYEKGVKDLDEIIRVRGSSLLNALASVDLDKYLDEYKKGIQDLNPIIRRKTANTLSSLANVDSEQFLELYELCMANNDEHIRRGAAESLKALTTVDKDQFVKLYRLGITDKDLFVRIEAAESLRALASIDSSEFTGLYQRLMGYKDYHIKKAVAKSLGVLVDINLNVFLKLFQKGMEDELVKPEIIRSLYTLALTLENKKLVRIKDAEYKFRVHFLNSNYAHNPDQVLEELKRFIHNPKGDYQRMLNLLKEGEANDLDEIVDCSQFKANELFLRKLGQGVSGETYLVYSRHFQREMAIKVLNPDSYNPDEVKILANLNHENIVRVWYAGNHFVKCQEEPVNAILMDYVDGFTISELLEQNSEILPSESVLSCSSQLFSGLSYLYSKGISHRDLNLNNIKVSSEGVLKILDFGIADDISCEQKDNRRYGGENDLQSLGQIMYKMATGEHLFNPTINTSTHLIPEEVKAERERVYADPETLQIRLQQVDENIPDEKIAGIIKLCLTAKGTEEDYQRLEERFADVA